MCLLVWTAVICSAASPLLADEPNWKSYVVPEFLWTGSWESRHNLTDRGDVKLTFPQADIALRAEALDRRPASNVRDFTESFAGATAAKAITQTNAGLYHLPTNTRLLYGTLDNAGLQARIRNVWIRGAPYQESNVASLADIKTEPSTTAVPQIYAGFESPDFAVGPGTLRGLFSYSENADSSGIPALAFGADYTLGKSAFRMEGFYTRRTLPERKSSTWFNEKPALPMRDTTLFAGTAAASLPLFGISADLACSETFAFGRDYYGSLGIRVGDKPWRFSLALDAAGSRYVDSAGSVPGAGYRAAFRLDRRSKKNGLVRLTAQARGPGPAQGVLPALQSGDFAGFAAGTNRLNTELYCRLPTSTALFGITRFSLAWDHDSRNEKKVLDTVKAMAAFTLGPVNSATNASFSNDESYRISQTLSWTHTFMDKKKKVKKEKKEKDNEEDNKDAGTLGSAKSKPIGAKKSPLTLQLSAKCGCEETANKDDQWDVSLSASVRSRKNRLSFKAAMVSKKWEFTLGWRLSL